MKGEWVWNREERVPLESSSEAAKAAAAQMRKADQGRPQGQPSIVGIQRAPGGAFYGNEPTVIIGTPLTEVGSLPKDPRAHLNIIQEGPKGAGPSPDMEALITIADGLRNGEVPADLRAALYKAAAFIPGVTVVDKQATLNGKTGVAIGIQSPDGGARQVTRSARCCGSSGGLERAVPPVLAGPG